VWVQLLCAVRFCVLCIFRDDVARGAALLAAAYTSLQRLDLCGGHITGVAGCNLCIVKTVPHLLFWAA
jgi:hypothetical protein